jgi:hypothetical protein
MRLQLLAKNSTTALLNFLKLALACEIYRLPDAVDVVDFTSSAAVAVQLN